MAFLSEQDRTDISFALQKEASRIGRENGVPLSIDGTKADVKILIDALDDFFENNKTLMNQSIPEPQRSAFNATIKAIAAKHVIEKRWLRG